MSDDPIVSEVRRTRERLAEQFGFDVTAIFADVRRRQVELGSRLVRRERRRSAGEAPPTDRDSAPLHPGR